MKIAKFTLAKAGAIAVAAVIATPAAAQKGDLYNPKPTYPVLELVEDNKPLKADPTIERITTSKTPVTLREDRGWAPREGIDHQPGRVTLRYEPGGVINTHRARFQEIAQRGDQVEILGLCQSACTLVLGYVPLDRICFGPEARLNFHKASNADGTVSVEYTIMMVSKMPLDIQTWIEKRGGFLQMPHSSTCTLAKDNCFWTLTARELWKM